MCCLWATKLTWDASICHVMSSHHPDDVVYRTTSLWFDRSLIKRGTFCAGRQTSHTINQILFRPFPHVVLLSYNNRQLCLVTPFIYFHRNNRPILDDPKQYCFIIIIIGIRVQGRPRPSCYHDEDADKFAQ